MKTSYRRVIAGLMLQLTIFSNAIAGVVNLADSPLYLSSRIDPNVLVDLSIESPMVGAAYNDENDTASGGTCPGRPANEGSDAIGTCYLKTIAYIGYFDPKKCYTYTSSRFEPAGATNINHECTGKWSGNFLNWATMTAIDEFRWALTGGNRSADTPTLTVLERANEILPKGHSWFPLKKIGTTVGPGNVSPSTVTPYGDATIYIYNHGVQFDIGTSTAANEKATNLNVQAKVCDSTAGLEINCQTFGTSYKPLGLIQNNADKMRFAVTSYLNDSDQSRGGGVLRSKMKYTGATKYVSGNPVANANTEWRSTDGTLISNPDPSDASASGVTNSGIINYINKFGANGYKGYDPAGELFYEALRYFKNLGPTPEYSSGLTAAMKDNFPVITTWDDPIQYSCQKNFIVGINDANPWLDKKLPGTAFTSATLANGTPLIGNDYGEPSNPDSSINVRTLTNTVGALEGLNGTSRCIGGNKNTFDGSATNKNISGLGEVLGTCPYPPKQNSYYIAGLAYYANTQDIRPDFPEKQTIASYMIDTQEYSTNPLTGNMNMLWLTGKYGGFIDKNANNRPDQTSEWDADGDGMPDNYVLASKPEKLVSGLTNAFSDITSRVGASSSVASTSTSLGTNTNIYLAKFTTGEWYADLFAYPISTAGVIGSVQWNAATLPSMVNPNASSRVVITYKPTSAAGIPFRWTNLDTAQKSAIQGADSTAVGQSRLDYLRGDASNEGTGATNFRRRPTTKLGDIINSSPQYVGTPGGQYTKNLFAQAYLSSASYTTFVTSNAGRDPVVYVGANDGMLHGFRAATGQEVLAYVPSKVYSNLRNLSLQNFTHKYLVDGSPTVADAEINGSWKTVLVGGLNSGGKGIYALDVTNPSGFSESAAAGIVMWEFADSNDADLGYTFSKPMIVKTNHAGKWAAIFGNGYNNTGSGKAVFYVLFIEEGIDGNWNTSDFVKIDTKQGSTATPNGLASVNGIDMDGNGTVDYVYGGDLLGNMWKFDISDTNKNQWKIAYGTTGTPEPLYIAKDSLGAVQPITTAPDLAFNPSNTDTTMVYFGTGKYLESTDGNNTQTQTFYGIWDKEVKVSSVVTRDASILQKQTISTSEEGYRIPTSLAIDWTIHKGWYEDLSISGERHVGSPKLLNGILFYNTFIPVADPCSYGGTGYLMAVNYKNGGLPTTLVLDSNGSAEGFGPTVIGGVKVGASLGGTTVIKGVGTSHGVGITVKTDGTVGTTDINQQSLPGVRMSWREVINK